ncbi:MAG: hypothetical protein EZS28_027656 [Streblomastix strix]|uniref:Uncharacterized protein n=1 Tax=Streblomastix strix TaxID=222440 RepID=A0A5J4V2H3_9EUKA|nr:MAG: hypothetical protein EZS28_027656 [Streblomastix strix]
MMRQVRYSTSSLLYKGVENIYELFKKNLNKYSKDRAALSIGYFFRARKFPDKNMREIVINHFTDLLGDDTLNTKAEYALKCLMQNDEGRNDDPLRKRIIEIGIVEQFIHIFERYELKMTQQELSNTFLHIIHPSGNDIKFHIYQKKPYEGILRLLDHSNIDIVEDSNSSLFFFLLTGASTSLETEKHPHFDAIQQLNGIEKIFELFKRNVSKYSKDRSALSIGYIFRSQQITNSNMRVDIINHIKTVLSNEALNIKTKTALNYLMNNDVNRSDILKEEVFKQIEQDLQNPIEGTEEEKNLKYQQQENDFLFLTAILEGRNDDELRLRVIKAGIAHKFLHIFETRDLALITRTMSYTFAILTASGGDLIRLLIFSKKPYSGLLRLLSHTNSLVVNDAIVSIFHILISGANSNPGAKAHPHYDMIQQLHGVQKIFELFKKNVSKYSKDRAALSIGYIYPSREITDPNMRFEIINYLVSVLGDSDMKVKVKPVFNCLADNIMNCAEILNEQVLMKIKQDLKQPLEGNEEQIKSIIQKQENWCFLLKTILEGRNDDVLRKNIIQIGIALQLLLHIFDSCELKIISQEFSNSFYLLMNPAGSEIKQLLFAMKPFQGILQLLDHTNIDILDDAIDSLFNFLIEGANKSVISKVHPYFDMVQQFNGIWKIYKLFLRKVNKNTRDTSATCLGFLFRSLEITYVEIKVQITTFLKNHINDKDDWNKNQSKRSLKGLSYNAVNLAEILNDEELKKIEHDLKLPLEESKENRKSTILIQEYWFLLLIVLYGRADDELRRQIIQARILDRFFRIFEQREYSLITNIITQAFISLIKPSSKDIGLLIFIKKPFTGLLRLLNHPNSQIVDDAISSIFHIII